MGERKEYDYGVRTLAEQLYVFHGRTYEEISRELGVSENQLKRWGRFAEWRPKREQYLKSKALDLRRMMDVKETMFKKLESGVEPNVVHQALSAIRQAESFIESKLNPAAGDIDRPAIFLEDLRFIVQTLNEVEPKAVQIVNDHFDLIVDRFKEQYAQAT